MEGMTFIITSGCLGLWHTQHHFFTLSINEEKCSLLGNWVFDVGTRASKREPLEFTKV